MSIFRGGLWALGLLQCVLLAQGQPQAGSQRAKPSHPDHASLGPANVVLITLDTTRADRMGFLGSQRGLTPNLDALAEQSVVFTRAYSQVPLTTASHATILTGTYPQFNHVNDFGVPLDKGLPDAPEILRTHGYRTGAFVGSLVLDPVEGTAPGFDRGFDTYDAGFHIRRPKDDRYKTVERRADEVVARALAWVKKSPRGRPLFLWVHLYDAHDPYDPPEPFKSRYSAEPYDGEIAYVDSAMGKLLEQLRASGLYENTLIAVMADHGESLGAHGENEHGVFLYDETIHVPLLFKLPRESYAGKRIEARAELVDVAPTILQVVGLAAPKAMQGESLAGMWKAAAGERMAERPAYAESDYPHKAFGWSSLRALRSGKYLYIDAPRREVYDQVGDPGSEHNLAASAPAVADTLKSQLIAFRQKTSASGAGKANLDPQEQEKLSALGYVASDDSVRAGISDTGADPKDNIEIVNLLHQGIEDVEDGRYQEGIPVLEKVLAKAPNTPAAYVQLGTAWSWLKDYDKALPVLRKAVEFQPNSAFAHYELGLALFQTGDVEGSAPEFEAAVALAPKWADLRFSLAAVYARIDRMPEAIQELQTTVRLKPEDFRANLMLGRLLTLQNNPAGGLPSLRKAVQLNPESPEAHLFLAEAYAKLGQEASAQRERAEAERLQGQDRP